MTADVSFIHISDTHIGSSEDFSLFGRNTFQCTSRLIDLIKKQIIPLDFVVHTGDLINKPDQASALLAKSLFSGIPCPLYMSMEITTQRNLLHYCRQVPAGNTAP